MTDDENYELTVANVGAGIDYQGFRAVYLPMSKAVVMHYRGVDGIEDSERLVVVGNTAEESTAVYLAKAMAHALNAGMTTEMLFELANGATGLAERTPIYYAEDLIPVGLGQDNRGNVWYLIADLYNQQAVVINPDIRAEVLDVGSFATWLEARTGD